MDYSFYNNLGIVHCTYIGCQAVIKKYHILCLKLFFTFANSANPDEMKHYAAFHLGLQYLYICCNSTHFWVSRIKGLCVVILKKVV